MVDKAFWENVRKVWVVKAPPDIKAKASSGGAIDPSLLKDPWADDIIPFDEVDHDGAWKAAAEGSEIPRVTPKNKPARPQLDTEKFDGFIAKQTLPDYVEACRLLRGCELPAEMDNLYASLIERIPVLHDAITKFEGVYQPEMSQFYDYYIPEALDLTARYLEYLNVGIDEGIVKDTESEVLDAAEKLLLAVNDKIDEIYKFAAMEIKAKAKALESLMGQDGYVNPDFKIN